MNIKQLILPFFFYVMVAISACKPDEPSTVEPNLTLETSSVNVSANGGTFSVNYSLENPIEGAQVSATPSVEWIHVTSTADGSIVFDVAANGSEQTRQASIVINYTGVDKDWNIDVVQSGVNAPEDAEFDIEVTDLTSVQFTFDIIPADKSMAYIYFVETADYFEEEGLLTDEDIVAADLAYFQSEADMYNLTLEQNVMDYYANVDELRGVTFPGAFPGEEYVIYVYGIEFVDGEMNVLTAVYKEFLSTPVIEREPAFVEVNVELNGANAVVSYNPGEYDGPYFHYVEEVDYIMGTPDATEEEIAEVVVQIWYEYLSLYLQFGFSIDMMYAEMTLSGPQQISDYPIYADTRYFAAALPVDEIGVAFADPTVVRFDTPTVERSDNQIEIVVTDIKTRSAYANFFPSNDDPYVFACFSTNYIAGRSDEEVMEELITYYSDVLMPTQGDIGIEITALSSATEYNVIAFGYEGGVPTTDMFKATFTTESGQVADIAVQANIYGIFDMDEVVEIEPAYSQYLTYDAFLAVEYITEPQAPAIYFALYQAANIASVDDESLLDQLLTKGRREDFYSVNMVTYGREYVIVAAAEDENGNVSPLFRSEPFVVDYNDRRDAQDFLDFMSSQTSMSVPSVAIETLETKQPVLNIVSQETVTKQSVSSSVRQVRNFPESEYSSNRSFSKR